jgi:serine/threonine protein kinase
VVGRVNTFQSADMCMFLLTPSVLCISSTGHDKSFDHWAWAIMVHEMLSGDVPFKESAKSSQMKLFKAIAKGKFKISDILNDAAKDLVKRILVIDVAERLGSLAGGVRDIKTHEWLKEIDFDKIGAKSVTPPWVPEVGHALDCSEFDDFSHEEFEEEYDPSDALSAEESALFDTLDDIMSDGFEVPV